MSFDNRQLFFALRSMLVDYAKEIAKKESVTNEEIVKAAIGFPYYTQNKVHKVNDICRDPKTEQPKRCVQEYDGSVQTDWTIETGTIWCAYHGTSAMTAYPWQAPTGGHDIYKKGEWMTYTDGNIYECISDTNFSPTDYAQAWKNHGSGQK